MYRFSEKLAGMLARTHACRLPVVIAAAIVCWIAAVPARASTIVNLEPLPASPGLAEFTFNNSGLHVGQGAVGNHDGNLPPALQTAGGLQIQTPFFITPGSAFGQENNIPGGTTTFYDSTLVLTGLTPNGAAQQSTPFPGFTLDYQPLKAGTFAIYSSSPNSSTPETLLLSGVLTSTAVNATAAGGVDGSGSANVISSLVQYNGGLIYNALVAHHGTTTGEVEFNLSLIRGVAGESPVLGINHSTTFLLPFLANGQGLFSTPTVPEPSSVALLGAGLVGLVAIASRKRRAA